MLVPDRLMIKVTEKVSAAAASALRIKGVEGALQCCEQSGSDLAQGEADAFFFPRRTR